MLSLLLVLMVRLPVTWVIYPCTPKPGADRDSGRCSAGAAATALPCTTWLQAGQCAGGQRRRGGGPGDNAHWANPRIPGRDGWVTADGSRSIVLGSSLAAGGSHRGGYTTRSSSRAVVLTANSCSSATVTCSAHSRCICSPSHAGFFLSLPQPAFLLLLVLPDPAVVAVCGADAPVTLDGAEVPMWQSFLVRRGQTVHVGATSGVTRGPSAELAAVPVGLT
jgi:hypothetical protein